jgi:hypothetical protein
MISRFQRKGHLQTKLQSRSLLTKGQKRRGQTACRLRLLLFVLKEIDEVGQQDGRRECTLEKGVQLHEKDSKTSRLNQLNDLLDFVHIGEGLRKGLKEGEKFAHLGGP